MSEKKPSERVVESKHDGKEITTEKGRVIKLRDPKILDLYDLSSAMGDEDSINAVCSHMAMKCLYIASIDGAVFQSPKSYADVRASISRMDMDGLDAIAKYLKEDGLKDEESGLSEVKK